MTVPYQVSDGTAITGTDYNGSGSGTLTFAPGVTGSYFVLNVLDDNLANETSPETVNLSLGTPTGAALGTPNAAVLDINEDNDGSPSPTVQFSQSSYTVTEGTTPTAVISVTLRRHQPDRERLLPNALNQQRHRRRRPGLSGRQRHVKFHARHDLRVLLRPIDGRQQRRRAEHRIAAPVPE